MIPKSLQDEAIKLGIEVVCNTLTPRKPKARDGGKVAPKVPQRPKPTRGEEFAGFLRSCLYFALLIAGATLLKSLMGP